MKNNYFSEWENEFGNSTLGDKRLKHRLFKIMDDLSTAPDKSVFLASGSRSDAKAAYRFLSNDNIEISQLLDGIRQSTISKIQNCGEHTILCVQDTTSIGFENRDKIQGIGYYCHTNQNGMNVHSSIAITTDGLSLGLLHQEYNTRQTPKDKTLTKDQKRFRPITEKETYQWITTMNESSKGIPENITLIHVCDREGDFYELFDEATKQDELFLIRIAQNRQTIDHKFIKTNLQQSEAKGSLVVNIAKM